MLLLGCAGDEHVEAFDSWYSAESSGDTSELYNGLHNCSVKHRVTIQTGILPLLCYAADVDAQLQLSF